MDIEDIKRRLIELQIEPRDLDAAIDRLSTQSGVGPETTTPGRTSAPHWSVGQSTFTKVMPALA